jgi:pimeloyl-ACP methyl ester carboxylesterase
VSPVAGAAVRLEVETGCGRVEVETGGSGPPALVLHRDFGSAGWLRFHHLLAESFVVFSPSHPGFGGSERPDWAREARDLAIIELGLLRALDIPSAVVVGCGFGGWIAAELATMSQEACEKLVLVSPMGVRPPTGEILDQFLITAEEYVAAGFADRASFEAAFGNPVPQSTRETWEIGREMATRVAWKPYMFNLRLPKLLPLVETPALVVWGDSDRVVPASSAAVFAEALPNSRLLSVKGGSHSLEYERPEDLARAIRGFAAES